MKCDNKLKPGWYRFGGEAGTEMLSSCPKDRGSQRRCGTYVVGWLNGKHPTVEEGEVVKEVCFHWGRYCCYWKKSIKVINCGNFYIYKLEKTPRCNLRFCGNL